MVGPKGRLRAKGGRAETPQDHRGVEFRRVEFVAGTGHWCKARDGLVPIHWVYIHNRVGTHRDEYFYTTDPARGW